MTENTVDNVAGMNPGKNLFFLIFLFAKQGFLCHVILPDKNTDFCFAAKEWLRYETMQQIDRKDMYIMSKAKKLSKSDLVKVRAAYEAGAAVITMKDLDDILKKADVVKEKSQYLDDAMEDVKLLWELVKDYKAKKYTAIPWKFIASVVFAIVYLINPLDVVPDVIPVLGYVDDASVFGLVFSMFRSDIDAYRKWKKGAAGKAKGGFWRFFLRLFKRR